MSIDHLPEELVLRAMMAGQLDNLIAAATPGGIEAQEARGQAKMIESCQLPKKMGMNGSSKEALEKIGIKVLSEADDLFFNVELPEGWKLKQTDHSMWSHLFDDKERNRASIFYKAAYYDRSAEMDLNTRYSIKYEYEDGFKNDLSWDDRQMMSKFGRVYDGKTIIFQTEAFKLKHPKDWEGSNANQHKARIQCEQWLIDNGLRDWESVSAYWEAE